MASNDADVQCPCNEAFACGGSITELEMKAVCSTCVCVCVHVCVVYFLLLPKSHFHSYLMMKNWKKFTQED